VSKKISLVRGGEGIQWRKGGILIKYVFGLNEERKEG
jgi:hypothetical protein